MKSALVIGCAANVWSDVKIAQAIARYDAIYCVKQMGIYYPAPFNVWVTLHPEAMDDYETQRNQKGFDDNYEIVAPPPNELGMHGAKGNVKRRVSYMWPEQTVSDSPSSGIYGAKVALEDGFDKIVLAGIPMLPEQGHFLPDSKTVSGHKRGATWLGHSSFVVGFGLAVPYLMGKVKSMSGHTKEVFGGPTEEWFRP